MAGFESRDSGPDKRRSIIDGKKRTDVSDRCIRKASDSRATGAFPKER
jgi:hypothetical protein